MNAPHDLDRQLSAFLADGPTELPDPSFDAVRDRMETTRQRVVGEEGTQLSVEVVRRGHAVRSCESADVLASASRPARSACFA